MGALSVDGGLLTFQKQLKEGSRQRLLTAAASAFCAQGYHPVSVEDIASAAGVSRMTFYRHFSGKAAVAAELFRRSGEEATPRFLAIGQREFHDRQAVVRWISDLFEADREKRRLLRVFLQVVVEDAAFTESGHDFINSMIAGLGHSIPAFALDREDPGDRRAWIQAWLVLYEIMDQSNHGAQSSGVAADPLIIEVLADRFVDFVRRGDTA